MWFVIVMTGLWIFMQIRKYFDKADNEKDGAQVENCFIY